MTIPYTTPRDQLLDLSEFGAFDIVERPMCSRLLSEDGNRYLVRGQIRGHLTDRGRFSGHRDTKTDITIATGDIERCCEVVEAIQDTIDAAAATSGSVE